MGSLILDVALGLFLVFFVLSLAASALLSIIQKSIHLSARNLRLGIGRMLGGDREVTDRFFAHPLITPATSARPTDMIDADEFVTALARAILPKGAKGDPVANLPSAVAALPDGPLKERLSLVVSDEFASRDQTVANLKAWFENAIRGVIETYAMLVRRLMYALAAVLVIGLNVNAVAIGEALYNDAALRQTLAAAAQQVADDENALSEDAQLKALECVRAFGGFPIGWSWFEDFFDMSPVTPDACAKLLGEDAGRALQSSIQKSTGAAQEQMAIPKSIGGFKNWVEGVAALLLGWLITIIAVAQGAPFWFDLLRSATGRGGPAPGRKPAPAPQAAAQ